MDPRDRGRRTPPRSTGRPYMRGTGSNADDATRYEVLSIQWLVVSLPIFAHVLCPRRYDYGDYYGDRSSRDMDAYMREYYAYAARMGFASDRSFASEADRLRFYESWARDREQRSASQTSGSTFPSGSPTHSRRASPPAGGVPSPSRDVRSACYASQPALSTSFWALTVFHSVVAGLL